MARQELGTSFDETRRELEGKIDKLEERIDKKIAPLLVRLEQAEKDVDSIKKKFIWIAGGCAVIASLWFIAPEDTKRRIFYTLTGTTPVTESAAVPVEPALIKPAVEKPEKADKAMGAAKNKG